MVRVPPVALLAPPDPPPTFRCPAAVLWANLVLVMVNCNCGIQILPPVSGPVDKFGVSARGALGIMDNEVHIELVALGSEVLQFRAGKV